VYVCVCVYVLAGINSLRAVLAVILLVRAQVFVVYGVHDVQRSLKRCTNTKEVMIRLIHTTCNTLVYRYYTYTYTTCNTLVYRYTYTYTTCNTLVYIYTYLYAGGK